MSQIAIIDQNAARAQGWIALLSEHGLSGVHLTTVDHLGDDHFSCAIAIAEQVEAKVPVLARAMPLLLIAESPSVRQAVAAMQRGAVDYFEAPVADAELIAAVERACAAQGNAPTPQAQKVPLVGSSPAMQALKEAIFKAAPTDSTILIQGESGTGKELVARAIHANSNRANAPLISLNCATVPHNLIEAELFGFEAMDSDKRQQRGLIDAAEGGTLFLDEIGDLPNAAQARLLRVVQGENRPVGSSATNTVDVRVIVATHRNLSEMVAAGDFREDLFYRLNVVRLELTRLSHRTEDILETAEWFLGQTSERLNKGQLNFTDQARQAMCSYAWPGNVRELENAIERAVILVDVDGEISQDLLAIDTSTILNSAEPEGEVDADQTSLEDYFVRFVLDNQDQLTETELADKLGISRKSLWERRQRLNIPRTKTRKRGPRRDSAS